MNFQIKLVVMATFISLLGFSSVLRAQSLSDLDMVGLEKLGGANTQTHSDPFSAAGQSIGNLALEDLQLTGIVFKKGAESFALISGFTVKKGDKIAGYKVEDIESEKVRLKRLDEVVVLSLGGGI